MPDFVKEIQIRWADLDPNVHVKHSVYYDWGAFCRISCFTEYGLRMELMQELQIGPILFREECVFRNEIRLTDSVTINLQLKKARRNYSRWTIQHTLVKNKEKVSAIITVDGAWLDIVKRKLTTPPVEISDVFSLMPTAEDFQWLD